jgi:hypothetical protein
MSMTSSAIAAATQNNGPPWAALIGIPAALVAAIALLSYFIGMVRPLSVRKPRYWHQAGKTVFSCVVKNRSLLYDRNVDAISFVSLPNFNKRVMRPFWRRHPQSARFLPWGGDVAGLATQPLTLTKRQSRTLRGEIRTPSGAEDVITLPAQIRIQAHSGGKRSRSRKVRLH